MGVTISTLAMPTNVQAAVQAGGSLAANTTYYVRVTAQDTTSYFSDFVRRSNPSVEISFTTTTTNKKANLTWNVVAGAAAYQVYLSTVSGNYVSTRQATSQTVASTATNSYLADQIRSKSFLYDTFAYSNQYIFAKNFGNVLVTVDSGSWTVDSLYQEMLNQGYSNYVSRTTGVFQLKGSIIFQGTGSLTVSNQAFLLYAGTFKNVSATFTLTFNYGTISVSGYAGSCTLDLSYMVCNGVTFDGNITAFGNPLASPGGMGIVLSVWAALSDCISYSVRPSSSISSVPINFTYNQYVVGFAYFTGESINSSFLNGYLNLWSGIPQFTYCKFSKNGSHFVYLYALDYSANPAYDILFTDCTFIDTTNNLPVVFWQGGASCNRTFRIRHTMNVNTGVAGATVTLKDKNGNTVFSVQTDVNGAIAAQVVEWYSFNKNSYLNKNPFVLTIEKTDYEIYTQILTISASLSLLLALFPAVQRSYHSAISGVIQEQLINAKVNNVLASVVQPLIINAEVDYVSASIVN